MAKILNDNLIYEILSLVEEIPEEVIAEEIVEETEADEEAEVLVEDGVESDESIVEESAEEVEETSEEVDADEIEEKSNEDNFKVNLTNKALKMIEDDIAICRLTSADVVRHALVQKIINAYESADKRTEDKKPVRSVSGRYQRKKINEQYKN